MMWLIGGCTSADSQKIAAAPYGGRVVVTPSVVATATPNPTAAAAAKGPLFVLLRAKEVTADARLNFQGQGFAPFEKATVTVEDSQGSVEATLDPVSTVEDGRFDEASYPVPQGLAPGNHTLHVVGVTSGRSARAMFRLRFLPPSVQVESYTGKAKHSFGFTGSGFAPGEQIDVFLGGLGGSPLGSYQADSQGNVSAQDVPIPLVEKGDYPIYFVGRDSQTPISVNFNVQGFSPWAVLDNYAPAPYSLMGFSGEDFVPDEFVLVYLNKHAGEPLTQVQADSTGRFSVRNAFELPLLKPNSQNAVIFVALQSGVELTVNFKAMGFGPGLELTTYAGRAGTHVGFIGSGWAHDDVLHVWVGEKTGGQELGSFSADESGAFRDAGEARIPVKARPGGLPLTVSGDVSQAQVTIWFQVIDMSPSAELSAYEGPPGTVVSFTGRSFGAGETVHVHLSTKNGPEVAQAVADDQGTFENVSSYPPDGDWGDVVPFVMVGEDSGLDATTHFKFAIPSDTGTPP
jgi:hypothetical protein